MKANPVTIVALWFFTLVVPCSAQAGDEAILKGFMGIMQEIQKQSGADADPNSKAIMDAFGKALDGKDDRRQGKGDRDRQGKGKGDRDRQGKGNGRQAKGDRQHRQN
jgi:hypothetical protein